MRENKKDDFENYIQKELFKLQDLKYGEFHSKLIPNVDSKTIIGVCVPELRKFSKEISKNPKHQMFLNILPHKYYEENNLHGFIIENIKDYDEVIYRLEQFFPYINNWATCDLISPKIFKKHLQELLVKIKEWIKSNYIYEVRFAIKMLLTFYLDSNFSEEHFKMICKVKTDNYYINMMIAWYFATALAKQYETAVKYIEEKELSVWVHNKTIQKAIESHRITDNTKDYLKTLKIKN